MGAITRYILSCGMPLLVEQMPGVRSAGISWLLPAGVGTDPAGRVGIGTLAAELLLRGAGERTSRQFADDMDRLGASRSSDVTPRWMRLGAACLGERAADVLAMMSDMVRRPRMEADAVEASRALALASLAGLKDNPQERAGLALSQRHNSLPLNRAALGTVEGITAATRDEIAAHWSQRARPGGSILAVAGAVEPGAIRDAMERLLTGWTGAAAPLTLTDNPARGSYFHEPDESNQVQVFAAHGGPAEADADSVLERLAVAVLSGGSAARLFSEVREKRGLCYSVSASYASDRDHGRVTAYVGTTPERAQEALDVLMAEMVRINGPVSGGGGATEEELQRAKVGVRTSLVFSGESTGARASALASDEYRLGRGRSLEEIAGAVESVTLDRLNNYLERRRIGRPTIVTLGPAPLRPPVVE